MATPVRNRHSPVQPNNRQNTWSICRTVMGFSLAESQLKRKTRSLPSIIEKDTKSRKEYLQSFLFLFHVSCWFLLRHNISTCLPPLLLLFRFVVIVWFIAFASKHQVAMMNVASRTQLFHATIFTFTLATLHCAVFASSFSSLRY